MRRTIAIAFLSLYLSTTVNLQEMMRVSFLLEHFREHKTSSRDVSFLSFIVLHYFHEGTHDVSDARHEQLPFKGACADMLTVSIAMLGDNSQHTVNPPVFAVETASAYHNPFNTTFIHVTIWQPPRA